jgi:hypothetical protein
MIVYRCWNKKVLSSSLPRERTVKAKLIQRLPELALPKLHTVQVVDDHFDVYCERALIRYINGEKLGKDSLCCPLDDYSWQENNHCDKALWEHINGGSDHQITTAGRFLYSDPSDSDSEAVSDSSEDSLDFRRRSAPKWMWARFFNTGCDDYPSSDIYCYQVPDSHPKGHATKYWKFTSRSGETACGVDPLDWFNDWDLEAGDVVEPTPYCRALREFYRDGEEVERHISYLVEYLGEESEAWDLIKEQKPPEGAFFYDPDEDPVKPRPRFYHW